MNSRVFVLFLFFGCALKLSAQPNVLLTQVSINTRDKTPKEIIETLEKNYNLSFSYSDNILPATKLGEHNFKYVSIGRLLDEVFIPLNISYKLMGSQIILFSQKEPVRWIYLTGNVTDKESSENLIGATVYISSLGIGTITNPYGFFSIRVPQGSESLKIGCLGYESKEIKLFALTDTKLDVTLEPKSYDVSEVVVKPKKDQDFLESVLMNISKMDVVSLQELPGLFGENDALQSLSLFPGIQSNELSTGSICVRGGTTDQTVYMMDEANLYNPSHFGGFFSVFNPDVVNNVDVFKSDIPVNEGGALSSIIDVRLREGNNQQWKVNGGIGLISARASVEGPLIKDRSSILIAFRRTYIDQVIRALTFADPELQNIKFYFYDANLKYNYKINENNHLFISGYSGSDAFNRYSSIVRVNHLATARWNHLFGPRLFLNTSLIYSLNRTEERNFESQDNLTWKTEANNIRLKLDYTWYPTSSLKFSYGYSGSLYNLLPFSLKTTENNPMYNNLKSPNEGFLINSGYFIQRVNFSSVLTIEGGVRLSHLYTYPFSDSLERYSDWLFEPSLHASYIINSKSTIKAGFSRHVQPLHQLQFSTIGIAIDRWMPATANFKPEISNNFSLGFYSRFMDKLNFSVETYYRKMDNLIETMQETRILYAENPESYLYHSSGKALGAEFMAEFQKGKYKGMIAYDYSRVRWITRGINNNLSYQPSHVREHNFVISNAIKLNQRMTFSANWQIASGTPYTAAVGKYEVLGRTYLQFDINKINTKKLPVYHRLDLSFDLAGKKNDQRRWKSYWNFTIYNAYFHKNPLGIFYFAADQKSESTELFLNPSYFYFYQFVPSVSYRFNF